MLKEITLFLIVYFQLSTAAFGQIDILTIGKYETIKSNILNEERLIYVSVPDNYNISSKSYPVIYLLDGDVHFDYVAGVVKFLSNHNRIPETIVVGITNTNRLRDFSPVASDNFPGSGGADTFINFMEKELFPFVEANYRISPYRTIIGHSLCGMFSIYTLINKPEMFNSYIAISPYVVYGNNFIMDFAVDNLPNYASLNKYIYYTVGGLEPEYLVTSVGSLVEIFNEFAPDDLQHRYKLMEGDDHSSSVLLTVYDGLKFVFYDWRLPDSVFVSGLEPILNHFEKLSLKYGYDINVTEVQLNIAGYHFLQNANNIDEALKIFRKNIELHPESANVYDSYGEGLETAGYKNEAVENYKKAIKLAKKVNHPHLTIFEEHLERVRATINQN
jgi:uncharacterized protein